VKTVRYPGTDQDIEYDETAPCLMCGLPVESASMGGTVICPWCDCGRHTRDGGEKYFQFYGQGIHPRAIEHYGLEFAKSADTKWIKPHLEGLECEAWSDRWDERCPGPHMLPAIVAAREAFRVSHGHEPTGLHFWSEEKGFYYER